MVIGQDTDTTLISLSVYLSSHLPLESARTPNKKARPSSVAFAYGWARADELMN
jgi:hypothetical protein